MTGARPLSALRHLGTVQIACLRCDRRGLLRYKTLLARFGESAPLPDIAVALSEGCSRTGQGFDRCAVVFPDLRQLDEERED